MGYGTFGVLGQKQRRLWKQFERPDMGPLYPCPSRLSELLNVKSRKIIGTDSIAILFIKTSTLSYFCSGIGSPPRLAPFIREINCGSQKLWEALGSSGKLWGALGSLGKLWEAVGSSIMVL